MESFAAAGYDEVYVAKMGPHSADMIQAYGRVAPVTIARRG
jgi:hypothetical protein